MADLITQEQRTSDDEGDSFTEVPCRYARRTQQPGSKRPVSAASSIADDNFFSILLVEGKVDGLEDGDEDYTGTDSDSGSGSEGNEMEITNEEAHTIFILLTVFTNYYSFQLAESLPRKIITEKTRIKKSKLKKWKAQSGALSASSSSKKAHVQEAEDEGEPSTEAQPSKVCHIHCHCFGAHRFQHERPQKLGIQSTCSIPSPMSTPKRTGGTRVTSTTSAATAKARFLLLPNA